MGTAERDMDLLLRGMRPVLRPGTYVYARADRVPDGVHPVVTVAEDEALTIVCLRGEADTAGLEYDYAAAWITLQVHSALDAVGLTAAVSAALADDGMPCNVVAGFHHDHLFVPHTDGARAVRLLRAVAETGADRTELEHE